MEHKGSIPQKVFILYLWFEDYIKWWDDMADIMETNEDNSPVSIDLKNVFHFD